VLIVDDNSELRETLADILELAGFDVEISRRGQGSNYEGQRKIFFHVVVLDIKL